MTNKEFLKQVAHSKDDFLQVFLDILKKEKASFCAIGGLAVNAYAEPLVSLDLDLVVVAENLEVLIPELKKRFKIEEFANSINIGSKNSDLRIQIQTDERYQPFIKRAKKKDVLGYSIPVATIEDVLQGKIWAAMDETRRPSGAFHLKNGRRRLAEVKRESILTKAAKRQKDLADILRLVESKKELKNLLPGELKAQLKIN